jgi:hypothetical protein
MRTASTIPQAAAVVRGGWRLGAELWRYGRAAGRLEQSELLGGDRHGGVSSIRSFHIGFGWPEYRGVTGTIRKSGATGGSPHPFGPPSRKQPQPQP